MPLENLSILGFLALALFFLFVLRYHWIAAGVVIGLSISVKPLLLAVLIVFLLARRWKALGFAVGIPVVLNAVSIAIVSDPGQVLSKLPTLLNRTGTGIVYNSAWVDVARVLGLPEGATICLRVVTVLLVVVATWLSWNRMSDPRLRIITATSALLIGAFLAGTLSEYHFMLTLVPLGMTVFIPGSPMRTVTGVVGIAWVMDRWAPPTSAPRAQPECEQLGVPCGRDGTAASNGHRRARQAVPAREVPVASTGRPCRGGSPGTDDPRSSSREQLGMTAIAQTGATATIVAPEEALSRTVPAGEKPEPGSPAPELVAGRPGVLLPTRF